MVLRFVELDSALPEVTSFLSAIQWQEDRWYEQDVFKRRARWMSDLPPFLCACRSTWYTWLRSGGGGMSLLETTFLSGKAGRKLLRASHADVLLPGSVSLLSEYLKVARGIVVASRDEADECMQVQRGTLAYLESVFSGKEARDPDGDDVGLALYSSMPEKKDPEEQCVHAWKTRQRRWLHLSENTLSHVVKALKCDLELPPVVGIYGTRVKLKEGLPVLLACDLPPDPPPTHEEDGVFHAATAYRYDIRVCHCLTLVLQVAPRPAGNMLVQIRPRRTGDEDEGCEVRYQGSVITTCKSSEQRSAVIHGTYSVRWPRGHDGWTTCHGENQVLIPHSCRVTAALRIQVGGEFAYPEYCYNLQDCF